MGCQIRCIWLLSRWLSGQNIADFRKNHAQPLKNLFQLYVQLLGDAGLPGKNTIAVDGSNFKAVNSKKNNYAPHPADNQNKIDQHCRFIEEKANRYLQQFDEMDEQENQTKDDIHIKKKRKPKHLKSPKSGA